MNEPELHELLKNSALFVCTRVWSAWGYGTMTEDDFVPLCDELDTIADLLEWRDQTAPKDKKMWVGYTDEYEAKSDPRVLFRTEEEANAWKNKRRHSDSYDRHDCRDHLTNGCTLPIAGWDVNRLDPEQMPVALHRRRCAIPCPDDKHYHRVDISREVVCLTVGKESEC